MRWLGYRRLSAVRPSYTALRRKLTIAEWIKFADNVDETRRLLDGPLGIGLISVLRTHIPMGFPVHGGAVSSTQAAVELGRVQGYLLAIEVLHACAEYAPAPQQEPEPDYGADPRILNPELDHDAQS